MEKLQLDDIAGEDLVARQPARKRDPLAAARAIAAG
jgi:hypothetical protein